MKKFDFAIVKDPKVFQENRLPAHSDHVCMSNWFEGEHNSFRMSLDGLWKFSYAKNMESAVVGFEEKDYSCKNWDEIRVPEHIPMALHSVVSYVKYFTLPINMRKERVCISFQGVERQFAVWMNGHYVGYSEDLCFPAEFELTPYLKEGENKLAVRVWNWTSDNEAEEWDDNHFSGIFRSVFLYMVPRTHLWDVQLVPELSEDLSEASLTIITTSCGKGEVEVRLLDDAMEPVLEGVMALEEGEEGSDAIQSGIAGMVYQPKLWSAEEPNLYVLQLEVRDEYGDLAEVTSMYVGFRHFDSKDGIMTLNGKPIVLKGINRPELSRGCGHVPNREAIIKDLVRLKQNNINAVCSRHYLNASYIYELCDEYGIYVIAENDTCYQRDKNHPAILIGAEENCEWDKINQPVDAKELSPRMQMVKFNCQSISVAFAGDTFTVWNKNAFVNTEIYDASVILQKDGDAIAKVALPISVEPLSKKSFDIPQQLMSIMDNLKIASAVHDGEEPEFAINVSFTLPLDNLWGKRGHEVAFGQHVYKKEVAPYVCEDPLEVVKGEKNVVVKGSHFKALFSNRNAGLVSYVYGGVEMLKSIPHPNFWKVPKENNGKKLIQQGYAQWKIASMYVAVKDAMPVIENLKDSVKLTYTFSMPTIPASSCQVTYHVFGDGTIETTMAYEPVEGLCDMPEFGMLFKLDADFDQISWYGLGPEETYADRMCGGKLGIYKNKVADNMAKYLVPQECGNKCGVRYAEITDAKGRGMRFFGDELSFSALPYTPHELENATHFYELPGVHYTVVRVAQQAIDLLDNSKKKVFTFCFRGV